MTFTTTLKEEISKKENNYLESRFELEAFFKCSAHIKEEISITLENASVARKIYKDIKMVLGIIPNVTVRIQKRFRVKRIYILTIKDDLEHIKNILNLDEISIKTDNNEERIAFLQGAFLAIGNVTNPQTSGYHLEFICSNNEFSLEIMNLLNFYNLNAKVVKRGYKYVVYIKASECISDLIKMFGATNALFFFEDIRIYRDHKNMVNRLNNCEISNQIKSTETGLKQYNDIKYLEDNDLMQLFDEKTRIVMDARKKYPEVSLNELAEIITLEYNYKIGKSGVNHHFIKISNTVKRHKDNN